MFPEVSELKNWLGLGMPSGSAVETGISNKKLFCKTIHQELSHRTHSEHFGHL